MIDMTAACVGTAELLGQVNDDQLAAATPCGSMDLGAVIAHIGGLSLAFEAAARKEFGELTDTAPEMGDGPDADWRTSYPGHLARLAEAWREPAAWEGMSRAGGVDFPADVGGLIALTEVVVHGWDVAVAAGLPYDVPDKMLTAVRDHVASFSGGEPIEGLFGAAVPVPDDAPLMDRVVALTGRDPAWTS
ncbi:TIGR03086 family metal-binding protein [Mycobacterium sp. pW049]|uniref:TIGR03086 family metal-binding protein n=1 Tax=[Mycobacterium] bulgaricum TaxID=3238985 RepID=UPI00351BE9C7